MVDNPNQTCTWLAGKRRTRPHCSGEHQPVGHCRPTPLAEHFSETWTAGAPGPDSRSATSRAWTPSLVGTSPGRLGLGGGSPEDGLLSLLPAVELGPPEPHQRAMPAGKHPQGPGTAPPRSYGLHGAARARYLHGRVKWGAPGRWRSARRCSSSSRSPTRIGRRGGPPGRSTGRTSPLRSRSGRRWDTAIVRTRAAGTRPTGPTSRPTRRRSGIVWSRPASGLVSLDTTPQTQCTGLKREGEARHAQ